MRFHIDIILANGRPSSKGFEGEADNLEQLFRALAAGEKEAKMDGTEDIPLGDKVVITRTQ